MNKEIIKKNCAMLAEIVESLIIIEMRWSFAAQKFRQNSNSSWEFSRDLRRWTFTNFHFLMIIKSWKCVYTSLSNYWALHIYGLDFHCIWIWMNCSITLLCWRQFFFSQLQSSTSPNKGRAVDLIYSNKNSFLMPQVSSSMGKERGIYGILHLFHFHTL